MKKSQKQINKNFKKLNSLLKDDPVNRNIEKLQEELNGQLQAAANNILKSQEIYITTGFYIPDSQTIETDGLSGALFLAKALKKLNKNVTIILDPHSNEIVKQGAKEIQLKTNFVEPNFDQPVKEWTKISNNDVLIAVERPGKGKDGKRKTMTGTPIPVYPIDELFEKMPEFSPNIKTISCADGLNEVGMGKLPEGIIPKDKKIQSIIPVNHLIIAGTADWAAYGLITSISLLSNQKLLPNEKEQKDFLQAIVNSGAVDGITGKKELTIDTLPIKTHQEKVKELRKLLS